MVAGKAVEKPAQLSSANPMSEQLAPALRFEAVDLDRASRTAAGGGVSVTTILHGIDWEVAPGERWAVLGPNGAGKTTIFQLASGYLHPTRGTVDILGRRLGRVDIRRLREHIGLVSAAITKMLLPEISAVDVVMTARHGALEPWWHHYDRDERTEAYRLLADAGFAEIAERPWGVLSEGERQQVLLARSLMARPALLLLDEPAAGLDVGGRERLVARLGGLAVDPTAPAIVMITHHVEEIPAGFTHVLLVAAGRVVAAGEISATLDGPHLSETFGLALRVDHADGRWTCRAQ